MDKKIIWLGVCGGILFSFGYVAQAQTPGCRTIQVCRSKDGPGVRNRCPMTIGGRTVCPSECQSFTQRQCTLESIIDAINARSGLKGVFVLQPVISGNGGGNAGAGQSLNAQSYKAPMTFIVSSPAGAQLAVPMMSGPYMTPTYNSQFCPNGTYVRACRPGQTRGCGC